MKAQPLILVALFFGFYSCNSDDDPIDEPTAPSELRSNGGYISALLTDTNGMTSPWSADLVRISRSQGRIELITNHYETGQTLFIEVLGEAAGAYIRDYGENESPKGYLELHRELTDVTYYSNGANAGTFTEFTVSFDTITQTANGTFDLSFDDDNAEPLWTLSNGQFTNVPYGYDRNTVEGVVNATINGVPFGFSSTYGFFNTTFNSLNFSFYTSGDFSPFIEMSLPSDISTGTYSAAENNLTDISVLCARYISGPPESSYLPDNLEITIIYHNLETRAIAGTYSFDSPDLIFGDTLNVRDGYFEFVYNDWN